MYYIKRIKNYNETVALSHNNEPCPHRVTSDIFGNGIRSLWKIGKASEKKPITFLRVSSGKAKILTSMELRSTFSTPGIESEKSIRPTSIYFHSLLLLFSREKLSPNLLGFSGSVECFPKGKSVARVNRCTSEASENYKKKIVYLIPVETTRVFAISIYNT